MITNRIGTVERKLGDLISYEYITLYDQVKDGDLALIFSTLQAIINNCFKKMNGRLPTFNNTAHYLATDSRELIIGINCTKELKRNLNGTNYSFEIDEYYNEIIEHCDTFLQGSGGSEIPENTKKITIYYKEPIFILQDTVKIENISSNIEMKLIGEGSYAYVYRYKDPNHNFKVVKKKAKENLNEKELERFKQEYDITKELKSPYIIDVYKYNEVEKSYTMESVDCTLKTYIEKNNSTLKMLERKNLCKQLINAFEYIHDKRYLHRDISPNNILIKKYDDVKIIKISDFGLVKNPGSDLTSEQTEFKGYFNDPFLKEIGFNNYSLVHEIYAVTKIIMYILTGKEKTFTIKDEKYTSFYEKGMNKDTDKRYVDFKELKEHFEKIFK